MFRKRNGIMLLGIPSDCGCFLENAGWKHLFAWILFITYTIPSIATSSSSADRCDVAQSRCAQNQDCLPVLRRYLTYCSDLIDGEVTPICWPRCRRVLPLLLEHPDGRAFIRCDCRGNIRCLAQRLRLEACSRWVESHSAWGSMSGASGEDGLLITCSAAKKSCSEDKSCLDALSIVNMTCSGVARTRRCGKACRNSLRTLYHNDIGGRLKSCSCSHSDDDHCNALRRNIQAVCHRRKKQRHSTFLAQVSTPSSSIDYLLQDLDTRTHLASPISPLLGGKFNTSTPAREEYASEAENRDRKEAVFVTSPVDEFNGKMAQTNSSENSAFHSHIFRYLWIPVFLMHDYLKYKAS